MTFQVPKVHLAVNLSGFLLTLGSGILNLVVQNPNAVVGLFPVKDALLVSTLIGAVATLLPTKKTVNTIDTPNSVVVTPSNNTNPKS